MKPGRKKMRSKKLQLHYEQKGHCWYCTRVIPLDAATVDHLVQAGCRSPRQD